MHLIEKILQPYDTVQSILVIGGCHITGYGVGFQNGFVHLLSDQLSEAGISHKIHIHPYITLDKKEKLCKTIQSVKPDLLLLQAGNYEFSVPSYFRKINSKSSTGTNTAAASPGGSKEDAVLPAFNPTFRFKVNQLIKHTANSLILYKALKKRFWVRQVDSVFEAIHQMKIKEVIILEPFPTANRVINRYRLIGGSIMKKAAAKFHFRYIANIHKMVRTASGSRFTIDEMHLNKQSHQAIGNHLSDVILRNKQQKWLKAV